MTRARVPSHAKPRLTRAAGLWQCNVTVGGHVSTAFASTAREAYNLATSVATTVALHPLTAGRLPARVS